METFVLDELTFVTCPVEPQGGLHAQSHAEAGAMRPLYPELTGWGTFAFYVAWGACSQEVYAIGWGDWLTSKRDPGFLAYCYISQRWPAFDFGGTGLFDADIRALGDQLPWTKSPLPPEPQWVNAHG